jgi:tellurite resistance protein TehA-like permease
LSLFSHFTVPVVFIRGAYIGGCNETKALYQSGVLEQEHLDGLVKLKRTTGTERLETARLLPKERSTAMNPPFWFPNTVNNNVVRMTGVQVCLLSALSAAFHWKLWARYLAVGLLVDFWLRLVAGSGVSPLGMIANLLTSSLKPDFRPGPPKQFAAFCGLFFSTLGTVFYFLDFELHDVVGAIWMGMLAGAAGLEGFCDFCFGCLFYGVGIQFGLLPDSTYRIHTATRQETIDAWDYRFLNSNAVKPVHVDTDPKSAVSLKYQKKTDEWTKDDFDLLRHMQVGYFAMPVSIAGLALAFKVAGKWSDAFEPGSRPIVAQDTWYHVLALIAAGNFVLFGLLYLARALVYPRKIAKEWDCPLRSNSFGLITICLMLFSFLIYDEISFSADEKAPQFIGRYLWWVGAVGHALLTVAKFGEWIGRRLELEHVHVQWMIFPVGLGVAALVGPIVKPFPDDNENSVGNVLLARFFYSFAWLMWITLFVVTFFKVVTTHNSDNRIRHGVFIWLAAPCILGMAEFTICLEDNILTRDQCEGSFAEKYFIGIFIFAGLAWATLPQWNFFGRDGFGMGYWIECFGLDTLAACAALFYALNGYQTSQVLQFITLTMASFANMTAFLHTCSALVRRRGVFTPEVKWGPLSFMKLTHEAFRGNLTTLRHYISVIDVTDDSAKGKDNLALFAAHFNRFCILHEEHAKHEDQVIFKTFNDFFPQHARKYNDDHAEDHKKLKIWGDLANKLLDTNETVEERRGALAELQSVLPVFFEHFEEHLRGEEDNLNPIGRKYLPLAIMKDISRQVWDITPANKWEIIVPFIITNLPRQPMRVKYLKVLCWSMPERAQQIGAIVYRNVDAVMWERLRIEVPEIIPRGAPGWKRYY